MLHRSYTQLGDRYCTNHTHNQVTDVTQIIHMVRRQMLHKSYTQLGDRCYTNHTHSQATDVTQIKHIVRRQMLHKSYTQLTDKPWLIKHMEMRKRLRIQCFKLIGKTTRCNYDVYENGCVSNIFFTKHNEAIHTTEPNPGSTVIHGVAKAFACHCHKVWLMQSLARTNLFTSILLSMQLESYMTTDQI